MAGNNFFINSKNYRQKTIIYHLTIDIKHTTRNDIPANTSFPPVSHQTTNAIIAAGKIKMKPFATKMITIIPIINRRINAINPIIPYDPINNGEIVTKTFF